MTFIKKNMETIRFKLLKNLTVFELERVQIIFFKLALK